MTLLFLIMDALRLLMLIFISALGIAALSTLFLKFVVKPSLKSLWWYALTFIIVFALSFYLIFMQF